MAGFQHCGSFGSQTADLGSSMAAFQPLSKVAMKLLTLYLLLRTVHVHVRDQLILQTLWMLHAHCWSPPHYGRIRLLYCDFFVFNSDLSIPEMAGLNLTQLKRALEWSLPWPAHRPFLLWSPDKLEGVTGLHTAGAHTSALYNQRPTVVYIPGSSSRVRVFPLP